MDGLFGDGDSKDKDQPKDEKETKPAESPVSDPEDDKGQDAEASSLDVEDHAQEEAHPSTQEEAAPLPTGQDEPAMEDTSGSSSANAAELAQPETKEPEPEPASPEEDKESAREPETFHEKGLPPDEVSEDQSKSPDEPSHPRMEEPQAPDMEEPRSGAMEEPKAPDMKEPAPLEMKDPDISHMKEPTATPMRDIENKNLEADILASMKEPLRPSLDEITRAGDPFGLPWSFEGPWQSRHPFDPQAHMTVILPETVGGTASFRDGFSTRAEASTEHLSVGLGITIGYPFLNAGAHVNYDRTVIEHSNGVQASRNASCRVGRVVLERTPPFAPEAIRILQSKGGIARFRAMFGDYYVCGYELGADAGACLSATTRDSATKQALTLTLTVQLLWASESVSHTEHFQSASASAEMTFSGYNTLGNHSESRKTKSLSPVEQAKVQQVASTWLKTIGALESVTRARLHELGVYNGERLQLGACAPICQSGLVVRLLMAPFARLNDYVRYSHGHALDLDVPD